jgi:hypothetical protein
LRKGGPQVAISRTSVLVEEIFAPVLVSATEVAHYLSIDVKAERLGFFEQPHAGLFRCPVPLAVIAPPAAGHQIIPIRIPAPSARHYVIESQVLRREDMAAILTGIMIAQQNIFA